MSAPLETAEPEGSGPAITADPAEDKPRSSVADSLVGGTAVADAQVVVPVADTADPIAAALTSPLIGLKARRRAH